MKSNTRHPLIIPTLLLISLFLSACGGIFYTPPTAAEYCDIDPALLEPESIAKISAKTSGKTVIELWSVMGQQFCWRTFAPLVAANQRPDMALDVRIHMMELNAGPAMAYLIEAVARGEAPDITFARNEQVARLADAGYIVPLDECRKRPEFRHIPEPFWTGFTDDGRAWGIPMDIEIMLLFYSKELLRQLGWSESQIDELPIQIANGDFTQGDLIATGRAAVDSGVVNSGLAFFPNRGLIGTIAAIYEHAGGQVTNHAEQAFVIEHEALETAYSFLESLHDHRLFDKRLAMPSISSWSNKLLIRDASAHHRVLFWHTHISEWQALALEYLNGWQTAVSLNEQIGVALLPALERGQRGYTRLANSGQYVILTEQATGRKNQAAACELLAATHASGLFAAHTEKSGHPTFAEDGFDLPEWFDAALQAESFLWTLPVDEAFVEYKSILAEEGVRVERGELTASQATDSAVARLREAYGDQLIVK